MTATTNYGPGSPQQGWICPVCGRGMAPWMRWCICAKIAKVASQQPGMACVKCGVIITGPRWQVGPGEYGCAECAPRE